MNRDGAPLRTICEQGGRIVLIDTLVYERFVTKNRRQWPASQLKLRACSDSIEVWKHVSIMCCSELKKNRPYGDPLYCEQTQNIRRILRSGNLYIPNDSEEISKKTKQDREYDSIIETFEDFTNIELFTKKEKEKIRDKRIYDKEVVQLFYNFVNNPGNIRVAIDVIFQKSGIAVSLTPNVVDESWAIWHLGKSLLVMYCYSQYQGRNIYEVPREHLLNTKHDLDYLVSLAFADAIASTDKKEMSYFRQWMFGDAKPLIDSYESEKIARVMDNIKGGSTDSFSQDLVARDQETLSQEKFMQLSLEERRQILAQQAEQMKSHYERTRDERTEWQAGDFIDVY